MSEMPAVLRNFLASTTLDQAWEIWEYLECCPSALDNMVEIVAQRHDDLMKEAKWKEKAK